MVASVVVFTVQEGTAGRAIAQLAASRLGYSYLDEEVVLRAAQLARVSPNVIASAEHWPGLTTRLLQGLSFTHRGRSPLHAVDGQSAETGSPVAPGYYRFFVDCVVLQLAHTGRCVISGHAAHVTLRGRGASVCSVLIQSAGEARAQRLARQKGTDEEDALASVRRSDREQAGFLKHFYQADWLDPSLYQLMLDPANLTESAAADVVVRVATALNEQPRAGAAGRVAHERVGVSLRQAMETR